MTFGDLFKLGIVSKILFQYLAKLSKLIEFYSV